MLLAAGCAGDSSQEPADRGADPATAPLESDPPLVGVIMAADPRQAPDDDLERRLAFTSGDTAAYAIVPVMPDAPGGVVAVAWYRTTADGGRRLLFTHEVAVSAVGGRVVSEGLAPGGLAPGLYETVATLGDKQVRRPWIIRRAKVRSLSGSATASPSPPGAGAVDWEERVYVDENPERDPQRVDDGPCEVEAQVRAAAETRVDAWWTGTCSSITISATLEGPLEPLRTFTPSEHVTVTGNPLTPQTATTSACLLPGGSDLPGAVVTGVVTAAEGSSARAESEAEAADIVAVGVEGSPTSGSRVDPGDTIEVRAMAIAWDPGLGVAELRLEAADVGLAVGTNLAGLSEPQACNKLRFLAVASTEYRVPANPPPAVEICAEARTFGDETDSACLRYPTGEAEVWEGTWDGGFHVPPPCTPPVWEADGTVSFTVTADGKVAGEARITNEPGTCGGTGGPGPTPAGGTLTGRRTDDGFAMELVLPGLGRHTIPLARAGNEATGELSVPLGAGARYEVDLQLRCTTCG
jgi:hypothetical protein